ncbi:MAG: SDR family NAD(P)-dependent oxidoreductase [Candidatus Manganitrophus sp.]|nr:SDR family NAD(P)-dependent oxidoreductase [Candidatus Manganitrophus sp.]
MRLRDKVALITGAGSGIGLEAARLFFERREPRLWRSMSTTTAGKETVKQIESDGGKAVYVHADVSKGEDCQQNGRRGGTDFRKTEHSLQQCRNHGQQRR